MRCVLTICAVAASFIGTGAQAQVEAQQAGAERAARAESAEQARAAESAERAARATERAARSAERAYEQAQRALDKRQWEAAAKAFSEVPRTNPRADGALYWAAYAENKVGRRQEALARLAELERAHPNSRWVNDAKALAIEIRQAQGQPVKPESEDDEELKLMALNGLMQADPERAVPMLERVLTGTHSPQLKERALFVLIQSGSPKAREIVGNAARGKVGNPDLQMKAISFLGVFRSKESMATLVDIAKTEKNPEIQSKAIEMLGMLGKDAVPELRAIYASNPDKQAKRAVLRGLFIQHNAAAIVDIARKETDPEMKREAVSQLSVMKSKEATDYMMEILK